MAENITRAQALYEFWKLAGTPEVDCELTYTDVDAKADYADAIRWATSTGITDGYTPETFGTNDPVRREQLITFVYRYIKQFGGGFDEKKTYELTVKDADEISDWAKEACAYCLANNYISASITGKFNPKANLTVEEAVDLLSKAIPAENEKLGILGKIKSLFSKKK